MSNTNLRAMILWLEWLGNKANNLTTGDQIATVGLVLAIIAAILALIQLRRGNRIARSQSWLALRDIMTNYEDVIANFRPGGKWCKSENEPHTPEEWSTIETYMGTFEYCKRMLEAKILDREEFLASYQFRITNLLANPRVVKYKLTDEANGWVDFITLCKHMNIPIPEPAMQLPSFSY
jgi:hypothetical protein